MSDRILVKEAVGFQMLFAAKYKFHFQQRLLKLNKTIPGIHGLLGYIGVDWVILHFRLSRGLGETALVKINVGIFHGAHDDFRTKIKF